MYDGTRKWKNKGIILWNFYAHGIRSDLYANNLNVSNDSDRSGGAYLSLVARKVLTHH